MAKKVFFNVLLNVILIVGIMLFAYGLRQENYFISIAALAVFGFTMFYKIKFIKQVRTEMRELSEKSKKTSKK